MSGTRPQDRTRPPMPTGARESGDGGSWYDKLVPSFMARAALTVEVQTPKTIHLGEQTSFYVVVKNRLPIPVTVSTPTSRLWGWKVDGLLEADKRTFSPPEIGRSVRFGGLERKVFQATWDGRIREEGTSHRVWTEAAGTHTLTGYLAVEDWERRGLGATATVTVRDSHQE